MSRFAGLQRCDSDSSDGEASQLCSFDLDGIAEYILKHKCCRIIVMCGAGISTSAGIPDFRTPGTGLYNNLHRFDLPDPEAIFDLRYFKENPEPFYELCKDLWPDRYEPTPCHYFIRLLHDKGVLARCYTQNIDSLEHRAGIPCEKLIACHGNFDSAHVVDDLGVDNSVEVDIEELKAALEKPGKEGWTELREWHGGLVKPKIVFFGEDLPERFKTLRKADFQDCDLLIVMGTSLQVFPFAGLLGFAPPLVPRLLINREPIGKEEDLGNGFRYHLQKNWRDVWYCGTCDEGAELLADLNALIDSKGAVSAPKASWAPI